MGILSHLQLINVLRYGKEGEININKKVIYENNLKKSFIILVGRKK